MLQYLRLPAPVPSTPPVNSAANPALSSTVTTNPWLAAYWESFGLGYSSVEQWMTHISLIFVKCLNSQKEARIVFRQLSLQLSATSLCSHMQPTAIPNIPQKYSDLVEAFSKIKASQRFPLYSSDWAIELLPGTTPPWGIIFSFEPTWVRPSTSPAWVEYRALSMHQLSRP